MDETKQIFFFAPGGAGKGNKNQKFVSFYLGGQSSDIGLCVAPSGFKVPSRGVCMAAVFSNKVTSTGHGGHELGGTLFTPAQYLGGHSSATCLHRGYQGAGIPASPALLTQVGLSRSKTHTMGAPPVEGRPGCLTVKKGGLFPTV